MSGTSAAANLILCMAHEITDRAGFDEAVAAARAAAAAYYDTGELFLSDADYDQLVDAIAAARAVHPDWDDQGVTGQVAAGASAGGDVTHPTPMLSLAKSKTDTDVIDWLFGLGGEPVIVEPKLDGIAVRAVYSDGALTLLATRGDGRTGEDITVQARTALGIAGLPATLSSSWSGEVRGEVYMTDSDFDAANAARTGAGKPPFVNPRNAIAGSLRNTDRAYEVPMSFAAYDIASDDRAARSDSYLDAAVEADTLGIATAALLIPEGTGVRTVAADVLADIAAIGERRPTLGYPIDGAVIKVVSHSARVRVGSGSHTPKWATAFKYPADTALTRLTGIDVAVGRTGRLGFRLVLDPVFVGGTTVTYATGHNAAWIAAADLRVGDQVWVYRAGDVIPRVTTANLAARPADAARWEPPTVCPNCDQPLDKSSLLWRCHTPSCSIVGALEYWCSRDCLDIDGVGTAICEALVDRCGVTSVADLYDLTVDQLAALPMGVTSTGAVRLLGETVARTVAANIEASKAQPFNRVITGLGVRMTGRSVGRWLAAGFRSMDRLRAAGVAEVADIEGLGEVKARTIVDGLAALAPVIDRLAAAGLTMEVAETGGDLPLAGQTFVVSGAVPGYTRTTIQERIEQLGGKASGSVSKSTTALVTAETGTSKAKKAAELGVRVIDPADFVAMIDG